MSERGSQLQHSTPICSMSESVLAADDVSCLSLDGDTQCAEPARTAYDPAIKLEAVQAFLFGGMSRLEVIEHYGIASLSTFKKWVIIYRREGEAGLTGKKRGCAAGSRKHVPAMFDPLDPAKNFRISRENQRLASKLGK